ncbi:unnamed protein product [Arabis nemorensis]|uniref:Uncharacterized protein n=1 Tax=Arabis nemorensis TaxID=586526 RepID=A0A565BI94_9BRAS|nr:unnamed protein product [Arabis nemorensis]
MKSSSQIEQAVKQIPPQPHFRFVFRPATSSKVQVSKLHKRKHQITSLFMDMKHKESELATYFL